MNSVDNMTSGTSAASEGYRSDLFSGSRAAEALAEELCGLADKGIPEEQSAHLPPDGPLSRGREDRNVPAARE